MCYGGFTAAAAPPAPAADLVSEFAWLDDLEDDFEADADLLSPEAGGSSGASSKTEALRAPGAAGPSAPQQQQQAPAPAAWAAPPMAPQLAMPGFGPMAYGAPYMMMPPMMPPQMAHLAPPPAAVAAAAMQQHAAAAAPPPMQQQHQQQPAASSAATSGATAAPSAPLRPGAAATMAQGSGKNRKVQTPEELDAAIERIKAKRRESAQRSRNRRATYMRQIENENAALREEVARLRAALASVGAKV